MTIKESRYKDLQQAINDETSQLQRTDSRLANVEQQMKELRAESDRYEAEAADFKSNLEQAEDAKRSECADLQATVDKKASRIQILETRLAHTEARLEAQRVEAERCQTLADEYRGRLQEAEDSNESECTNLNLTIDNTESQLRRAERRVADLEIQVKKLRADYDTLQVETAEYKGRLQQVEDSKNSESKGLSSSPELVVARQ